MSAATPRTISNAPDLRQLLAAVGALILAVALLVAVTISQQSSFEATSAVAPATVNHDHGWSSSAGSQNLVVSTANGGIQYTGIPYVTFPQASAPVATGIVSAPVGPVRHLPAGQGPRRRYPERRDPLHGHPVPRARHRHDRHRAGPRRVPPRPRQSAARRRRGHHDRTGRLEWHSLPAVIGCRLLGGNRIAKAPSPQGGGVFFVCRVSRPAAPAASRGRRRSRTRAGRASRTASQGSSG